MKEYGVLSSPKKLTIDDYKKVYEKLAEKSRKEHEHGSIKYHEAISTVSLVLDTKSPKDIQKALDELEDMGWIVKRGVKKRGGLFMLVKRQLKS